MVYQVGTTEITITIPAGFVTDLASIPQPLWSLLPPNDQYSRAAIVHDYLYWSQLCTREQADNLFLIAMKESEVPQAKMTALYEGVHNLGASAWKTNADERAANMPKVVPAGRTNFPWNWSWEMYRQQLVKEGVTDPVFSGGNYCMLGDSKDVPSGTAAAKPAPALPETPGVVRAAAGMDEFLFLQGP